MLRNLRADQLDDPFEPDAVGFREIVELIAVDVEHAEDVAARVEHRHDDLGLRGGAAGDVPGELVHLRNDHGLTGGIRVPADPRMEIDPRAGERALERAKDELTFLFEIEPDPEEPERLKSFLDGQMRMLETTQ